MGNVIKKTKNCVFCEIVGDLGREDAFDQDRVHSYNDNLAIISDLHPVSKHHYLVVPTHHVKNPKTLEGTKDVELVKKMLEYGKNFLQSVESDPEMSKDSLLGFHYPPFVGIDHLHLHVICPASEMNSTSKNLFQKDAWFFVSPEKLIKTLEETT